MGRSRSYQLLDQGRVIHALADAAGKVSTDVDISEAQAREIKDDLPTVTAEIRERVEARHDETACPIAFSAAISPSSLFHR